MPLRNRGIDSIGLVRLVSGIETSFGVQLPEDEIFTRSSLSQIVELVCRQVGLRER